MPTSIFSDEWRECLVAHYTHVLRNNDQRTERTLRGVMLDVGFTEDDLSHIYLTATAHVDDVPADFTPDSRFVESVVASVTPAEAIAEAPTALSEPLIEDVSFDTSFDDIGDSQELLPVDESELMDESEIEDELTGDASQDDEAAAPPDDPDATQLSLF